MIPLWLIGLFVSSLFLGPGGIFQAVAAAQVGFYTLAFSLIVNHAVSPIKGWLGVPAYFITVPAASWWELSLAFWGARFHGTRPHTTDSVFLALRRMQGRLSGAFLS